MFGLTSLNFFSKALLVVALSLLVSSSSGGARSLYSKIPDSLKATPTAIASEPLYPYYAAHNRGNMQLLIGNNGTIGGLGMPWPDPLTGEYILSCMYPKFSNSNYLFVASLWIGAVVGRDTLVSVGNEDYFQTREFWPTDLWAATPSYIPGFEYKSLDPDDPFYAVDGMSEQDIICEYDDTKSIIDVTGVDVFDNSIHIPLNIKIRQHSMVWSYDYADDFVLFDYKIKNIGVETLNDVYMGIWVDGDVLHRSDMGYIGDYYNDDITGFYRVHPAPEGCGFVDTVNIAFHADNDGDPTDGTWTGVSLRSAMGVRVVRTPSDSLCYSYNWWITHYQDPNMDFGPRLRHTKEDPFRDFGACLGTPMGDHNKYYVMQHDEFDYDLVYTALDHSDEGWLPPPQHAENFADGFDQRYLLSFGPFQMDPGETLPITFAWVGGEDFHHDPTAFEQYWDPYNPWPFYRQLDFSSLAENARWASWIYDNPGYDTDGNDYAGKSRFCCADSIATDTGMAYYGCEEFWYEGDGVPDFRGASPPPAPKFWLEPDLGSFRVCFNGLRSETTGDSFTELVDFEGYRVYIGRDERKSSFSMVASYDREDYSKYVYYISRSAFGLPDPPFTREELQELYGHYVSDSVFDPLLYTQNAPFRHPEYQDSIFYFVPQDFNQSILGVNTPIQKVYPNQPYPSTLDVSNADPDELTEEGRFKYFEYEITIDNLLPTIPYYVNVTAFDFGSPQIGVKSMETPVTHGAKSAYPLSSIEEVEQQQSKVFVYPNPYRADDGYEDKGFENRSGTESQNRMRRIHFANLPRVCKIYIYSLDGDLIRELDHDYPEGDPMSTHDTWDLITRNTQAVVSGLYYWVVESDQETQIGKFVIIK